MNWDQANSITFAAKIDPAQAISYQQLTAIDPTDDFDFFLNVY